MKALLVRLACLLGLGALLRWWNRERLLVLMYHGVVPEPLEPFCWHQLPLDAFRKQLQWIAKRYRVMPLEQALALRAEGMLPPRSCAITFDDGYENVQTTALPVLDALRLPATVYVVTDLVGTSNTTWPDRLWLAVAASTRVTLDTPEAKAAFLEETFLSLKALPRVEKDEALARHLDDLGATEPPDPGPFALMDWTDVAHLAREGLIAFGPHSTTHEILSHCEDEEVEHQVSTSVAVVAERSGRPVSVFAYPNGRAEDFDARAVAALERAGVPYAVSTVQGLVGPDAEPYALPRICVGADLSFDRFRLLCSGL